MKRDILTSAEDTIDELAGKKHSKLVNANSILLVTRGMILAHTVPVCMVGCRVAFNQDIKALVPSSDFEPWFLFYFLQHQARTLLGMVEDSTHGTKRLATDPLMSLSVPKPSLQEQKRIVSLISKCDVASKAWEEHRLHLMNLKRRLLTVLLKEDHE